jgi:hypothetical protein
MPHMGRPTGRRSYAGRREALAACCMLCDADGDDTSDSGGGPSARDCFSRCCSVQRIHQRHCKLRRYNASQTELQVQRDGSDGAHSATKEWGIHVARTEQVWKAGMEQS